MLCKPQYTATNIETLYGNLRSDQIDLNADYQRKIIWDAEKQGKLIDSIMKCYPIPSLIFNIRNGKEVCMDGKQRLTSILNFYQNTICYKEENQNNVFSCVFYSKVDSSLVATKETSRVLTPAEQLAFHKMPLHTVNYVDLDEFTEIEIFHRIQNGMALTSGEKMKAISKNLNKFMTELIKKHETTFTKFFKKNDREQHRPFYTKLFYMFVKGRPDDLFNDGYVIDRLNKTKEKILLAKQKGFEELIDKYMTVLKSSKIKKMKILLLVGLFHFMMLSTISTAMTIEITRDRFGKVKLQGKLTDDNIEMIAKILE